MAANLLNPQFFVTFGIFAASAGTVAFLQYKSGKPRETLTPPLVTPQTVMIIALAIGLLAAVHLSTLLHLR